MSETDEALLAQTESFWDGSPCDAQDSYEKRYAFRYAKEPWILPVLKRVAAYGSILEVGCGQGTDALTICLQKDDGTYIGMDLSAESLANAEKALGEARARHTGMIMPQFVKGNAECLPFPDCSFDCVFSLGVLHHSPDTVKAVGEVKRVLKKSGTAFVFLYRRWSPKLMVANAIRRVFPDNCKKRLCMAMKMQGGGLHASLGTMLEECLGVPVMRSYTKRQIENLFADFSGVTIGSTGSGFPVGARFFDYLPMFSYMFQITCKK